MMAVEGGGGGGEAAAVAAGEAEGDEGPEGNSRGGSRVNKICYGRAVSPPPVHSPSLTLSYSLTCSLSRAPTDPLPGKACAVISRLGALNLSPIA